jgi:hypothetical protein
VGNAAGLEKTLNAMGDRLGDEDQALVALTRCLAVALDAEPENASLAREYRQALVALAGAGSGNIDDDTRDFLLTIRTPRTALGDR